MQTSNSKGMIIVLSALLVVAFFMPWIKFFVSINAWNMVFGEVGELINTSFRYIAVLIPAAGLLILHAETLNNGKYLLPKKLLFLLPLITLILIAIAIGTNLDGGDKDVRASDIGDIMKIFGIGFWLTLASAFILPFYSGITNQSTINTQVTGQVEQSTQPIQANPPVNTSQPQQPMSSRSSVNINLPKVNWNKTFSATTRFILKYRIWFGIGAVALITFLIIYNLFIKDDPIKDGKNLAKNYCDCNESMNKTRSSSLQSFLDLFDKKKYKTRKESRDSLGTIENQIVANYNSCVQKADLKYKERYAEYSSKKGKNAFTFQQTYNSLITSCNNNLDANVNTTYNAIQAKIKTILEPEPDIEKIKLDLIGKQIPGWTFSYLSQYKNSTLINQNKTPERTEYQIKFVLTGNQPDDEHECEMMIVYLLNDNGWFLDSHSMNYITFNNTLYPDRYISVFPLANCNWNAENNYKISWKTSDWENASETLTGPDKPSPTLPYSNVYYLKSLENHEIKVKFTYRPQ